MTRLLGTLVALWLASTPLGGTPVHYSFDFQTPMTGVTVPTGGFTYDDATGLFADFVVVLDGVTFEFTTEANAFGGPSRIRFEMGYLAQNLIDGFGPLGPELSHWYAGPDGFYGFEWRTPAEDFLYVDLTMGAPSDPISSSPRAVRR